MYIIIYNQNKFCIFEDTKQLEIMKNLDIKTVAIPQLTYQVKNMFGDIVKIDVVFIIDSKVFVVQDSLNGINDRTVTGWCDNLDDAITIFNDKKSNLIRIHK